MDADKNKNCRYLRDSSVVYSACLYPIIFKESKAYDCMYHTYTRLFKHMQRKINHFTG